MMYFDLFVDTRLYQGNFVKINLHVGVRFEVKVVRVNDSGRPNRNRQVKMTGNFRKFAIECGFKPGKIMRFKLVNKLVVVIEGKGCEIPVFDVC